MTKELWEKYSENWGNGCPLMPEEQFYKALFDYREWLLSQQPIAGQVEPVVMLNFADIKQIPDIFVKIHSDAGTYKVYGIDWMHHIFLVDRNCGLEKVPFEKCRVISKISA